LKELGANVEERFRAEGKHYGQTLAPDLLDGKYFKLGWARSFNRQPKLFL